MADVPTLPKLLPSLAWYRPIEPAAYGFIRCCTGSLILVHGIAGILHVAPPTLVGALAPVVGPFETIAGILLAVGLLTRPVALLLALEWLAAAWAVPLRPGTSWLLLGATPHYPAMIAAFCVAFLVRGGGRYSLDRLIGKEI